MKAILPIGFLLFAAIVSMGQSVLAIQVSYSLNEVGGSGIIKGGDATELNERLEADIGTYQFSGSVLPDRTGLIGVRSGFRAAVSRFIPGFSPEPGSGGLIDVGGEAPDSDTGLGGPFEEPFTEWSRVTIDTLAAGTYQTVADINGLSATNDVGFVQFDWVVSGTSNLFLDATGPGDVTVNDALSLATIRPTGDLSIPDTFLHDRSSDGDFINDLSSANLEIDSFLVPFDFTQLDVGETPQIAVDFELAVATRLDITNDNNLGNFEALFDADFDNTATLINVTVLDVSENAIIGASVTDSFTGTSLVASSVPEPSSLALVALIGCVGSIRRRRQA